MTAFKVHIIHVGNMNNKGTQALFKSDVYAINDIVKGDVFISVSTTDIEGVKGLNLSLNVVLPPVVDIPYEKADQLARKFGCGRDGLKYKGFALAMLFYMFIQVLLSVFSIVFAKAGLKVFYRAEVIEHVKNCDLVVSHSDESFKESASLLPLNLYWVMTWWSMLIARTWEILVAKSFRKPVVLFPNSVGPFRTRVGRFLASLALNNCDCVLVREPISFGIVQSLNVKSEKVLTSDTSILLPPVHKATFVSSSDPMVGVCLGIYSQILSEEKANEYIITHARALDNAIERYGFSVVFLPHYVSGFHYDDLEMSQLILGQMRNKNRARIVNTTSVDEFRSFLARMDMVISSKMHPAVLATSQYVPTLCIAYDQKQTGYFKRLSMIDCVISVREVSFEDLLSKIGYVWNRREKIETSLREVVPALKEETKGAIKFALSPFLGAT